jgi:hypothetical protein
MDMTNPKDVSTPNVRDTTASHVLVNPNGKGVAKGSLKSLKAAAEEAKKTGKIASLKGWRIQPIITQAKQRKASTPEMSVWKSIRQAFKSVGLAGGSWNEGRYAAQIHDYGQTVEVEAVAHDREGTPLTAGTMSVTLIHEAPGGRYATLEVNDDVIGHNSIQRTVRKAHVKQFVSQWMEAIEDSARDLLNQ